MRLMESYFAALGRRGSRRLRAVLVLAHIAISVALVIVVAGMAQGLGDSMNNSINQFVGSLSIAPKVPSQQGSNAPRGLKDSDVKALQDNVDPTLVKQVVPVVNGRAVVRSGTRNYGSSNVVGSSSGYLQLKLMQLQAGSMFTDAQYDNKARVALIGPKLVDYLFDGDTDQALRSTILVGFQRFDVIGVLGGDGADDATVLVPMTSSRAYLYGGVNNVVAIGALVTNLDSLSAATEDVQAILDRAHYVKEPDERDFSITSYTYLIPFMKGFISIPRWFAAGATTALLFIGIFGLANLMLITVTERQSRIRYRRATGVHSGAIVGEVLFGSTVIAAVGAVFGILLGVAGILVARAVLPGISALYALGLPPIPVEAIVLTFVASLLVGLVAGAYPAIRAARAPWDSDSALAEMAAATAPVPVPVPRREHDVATRDVVTHDVLSADGAAAHAPGR
ncbi:MAG TPA: ABC transporter permease [Pseudonocardia sp.]|jgi:putative ABC transport system permease protein|nr:ABC transporter permease [Pseudonocardia sp.]